MAGVKPDVLADECRYKEIAVVVAGLNPEIDGIIGGPGGLPQ